MNDLACLWCGCTDANPCVVPGEGYCAWALESPPVCTARECMTRHNSWLAVFQHLDFLKAIGIRFGAAREVRP